MDELHEIITGCIRNDRAAQEKFYRHFYPSMFCLCKKFFRDDHAALEAVNDGMMKVFAHLADFKAEKGAIFNWVYTIVRHTALDKLKVPVRVIVPDTDDEDLEIPTGNILEHLEWRDVYHYLDHLPPATRAVFSLFYLEHFKIPAIAERLKISTGTVKWQLSEGRKIMQPVLKKHFSL
ncbi:sigma-70 family RNA polymerase sigma factor [Paraflavitalea sp. CAU 1676]|uniref:RNA polymerase sigma factor n=1 Tax=Paraflavitalea sp. CAU 1676 TaxID=3032598 RepID=UPI0023DC9169|nr:sigma-70 family RNA polymerase sigma factor [Paraflavitalea sp. CAU 1676]MDF2187182.1 sigma-70 family RNA polymerase sigma factor [Paraflavitalea sp. CAU 1676]